MNNYEPYSIEIDPDIHYHEDWEDWTLTKVEPHKDGSGWTVTGDSGLTTGFPRMDESRYGRTLRESPVPKVGDTLRVYGSLGRPIRGMVLNGVVVWYRTKEQQEAHQRRQQEDFAAQRRREFLLQQAELDARYDALPEPFKKRVDRFRAADPKFREESEGYETFTLQQAALLADTLKTPEAIHAWKDLKWEEQVKQVPGWSDGHSGNTHGMAIAYAIRLLEGEDV